MNIAPNTYQNGAVPRRRAVGSALLSGDGDVISVDQGMAAMLDRIPTGWVSFPPEVARLASELAGGTTWSERIVVEIPPDQFIGWAVTALAGRGWLVQAEDLSEVRRLRHAVRLRDERLKTLAELHRLLGQVDFDVEVHDAVRIVAERTRALLGADIVGVGMADNAHVVYDVIAGRPDITGIRVPIQASVSGVCIRTDQTQVSHDTERDHRVAKQATRRVGARSLVAVPIRHGGHIPGVLLVLAADPFTFTPHDIHTVESVGGAISAAYGHAADLAVKRSLLVELRDNVEALQRGEAEMRYLARHDALTGLPNRNSFLEHLAQALSQPQPVAVVYADVDNFKGVNDSLGHPAGDLLLREIAHRLRVSVAGQAMVARFGGDEFTVMWEGTGDSTDLSSKLGNIVDAVARPLTFDDTEVNPTLSIGATIAHGPDGAPESVLKAADAALFEAKRRGRARWSIHRGW
jgi:diguanylate cyclase (GGDEF)-like protein